MSQPPPTSTSTSTSTNSSPVEPAEVELTQSVDSISDLFARDPMEWSEADMQRMIEKYRTLRKEFDAKPESAKRTTAAKVPKEDLKGLSTDDLLAKLDLGL